MLDDCMSTQIPLSVAGSESTRTKRLLTGISFFDLKSVGDHTPISPSTIMGKDFHLKCSMRPGCFFSIPVASSLFISVIKSKVMKVIITLIIVALLVILLTSSIWKNRRL
jgi:hypothetical protein